MKTTQRMGRRSRLALFIATWMVVFGGASTAAAGTAKKIRLAYAGWQIGTAVSYVGVDAGIFKKHDLDIEEIPIRDTFSAGVQSLLGVDMLIGFGPPLAVLQPMVSGGDLAVIGSHVSVEHYGMGVSSSISAIKDLKGKKVGVSALGTRSDLIARVILRRAGLDPVKDVEVVAAGISPTRAIAISKDLVQGAPLTPDVAAEAKKLGVKILDVKGVPVVTDLIITTRSFIKREEDTVRRFLKSYAVAIHHLITRREDSLAIIKKYFPSNQAGSVEAMYDAFAAQLRPLPDLNTEAIQALVDVATVVEQRTKTVKPADMVDQRFLEELKNGKFLKDLYTEKVSL
jgi:NitT/TauT family transport system substrate-binding protein